MQLSDGGVGRVEWPCMIPGTHPPHYWIRVFDFVGMQTVWCTGGQPEPLQDALEEAYASGRYGHASTGVDMKFKIFGRSPTLALQAVAAVLTFLVTFGWDRLTAEHAGLIVAFLTAVVGVVNAWLTLPRNPTLFATAFTSGAALLTAYGLDFTQEQIGTANMAVTAIMGFILLNYVTPAADPAVGGGVSAKDVPGAPAGLTADAAQ